ncbi:hypothetical protein [Nocardioides sp. YIM 152315]|uniref:hypothetical protein n=1 Tax=Nocardioides sp. YIM 152315 TaxID=3031760 RepID=UPI0023DC1181|nr:hypothetical protein [Nocardioides sp. YIM 152315]MDF1603661.1 hypothetical protein [Nocardioides sp. YIM 152315]
MVDRLVLHVGLLKSGTTFVQARLGANLDELDRQGVLFPTPWSRQVRAVTDLASSSAGAKAWARLVDDVRDHPGTVLVSMEFMAPIAEDRIRRVLADFPDARVEAVITVRDLGRVVPAMWQETLQNRRSWGWGEFQRAVRSESGTVGKRFWRQQDLGKIARRWAKVLGPDRVTVITVPPAGAPSEQLWDRFCAVVGLAPATWAAAPRANESLGAASALLLGRLNAALGDVDKAVYNRAVKKRLAKQVLAARKGAEEPIGFVVPGWLRKRSDARSADLAATGVRIVGDLAELVPLDVPGVDPDAVDADQQLDAAVDALARIVRGPGRRG